MRTTKQQLAACLMTADDVAAELQCSRRVVAALMASGELPSRLMGKRRLTTADAVLSYLEAGKVKSEEKVEISA